MPEKDDISTAESMRLQMPEFYIMNNPLRRYIQKHMEFGTFNSFLKKRNISLLGKIIIDAGCGSGYSSRLIADEFKPADLISFDIMPEQIAIAQKRYEDIDFRTGDLMQIQIPDNTADALFIFGILHHIPEWRKALKKIAGFLKPSGVFLVEEPDRLFMGGWSVFEREIINSGLEILERKDILGSLLRSYLCMKTKD